MAPTIGRFEVVRELGKSELGTVYKAYDPKKKRTVALRVLLNDSPSAQERSRQYLLQAKAASVLDSPNIVSVYAGAEEQDISYVVMEFVEGVPLDAALATQQGFSSSELLDISRQVCRGLDHAHSKGIFHRRLTPPGILTEWDGTVKILDFAADFATFENRTADDLRYLSPEQVQGHAPDARSNVFNWGAILYEMVTGNKAFPESDPAAVQQAILDVMPPAPQEVIPRMPAGISRVIMKALAKNPEYRFQRAGDLVNELEAECESSGRASVPGVPHVKAPPPAPPAPTPGLRIEAASNSIPGSLPYSGNESIRPAASVPVRAAAESASDSEQLLGYEIPESIAAAPAKASVPAAAPAPVKETIAPAPPAPKKAVPRVPGSLSPLQIKILAGAVAAALVVMVVVMIGDSMRARRMRADAEAAALAPLVSKGAPDPATAAPPQPAPAPPPEEPEASVIHIVPKAKALKAKHKTATSAPAPIMGELAVNSVPEGARVQVDGNSAGVTPVALTSLSPGQHVVILAKPGYAAESRSVVIHAGIRNALAVNLNGLAAVASIASEPAGAAIIIDGRDTGKTTPAKLTVDKGAHALVLRKAGYMETSATMALNPGETFQFQPTLKPLGNADEIKQVNKLKKLIGRGGQEDMARVTVHTFPKGAQIMFNSRMMDRSSPAEFLLGPGTYEVTLTLTGYKPVHKLITVESNGRMEVNETMER